jgi:hypothetical protein
MPTITNIAGFAPRPAGNASEPAARRPSPPASPLRRIALFVALMATAIGLGPALAHLFELPNQINLPKNG